MTKLPRVLFVDDNLNLLNGVKRVLRKQMDIVTAEGGAAALQHLEKDGSFDVLISDQNMPNMKGDALLSEVAKKWPMTVRIMLTGNDDQTTAAAAVNSGQVFRFLRKPCDPQTILEVVNAAAEHHRAMTAEKELLEKTVFGSVKVLSDMLAILRPGLFERSAKVRNCARMISGKLKIKNAWELDLAAMLYPLGFVALPDSVCEKFTMKKPLSPLETQLIDQSTEVAAKLVSNIPRLEGVAAAIRYCRQGFDGSGYPNDGNSNSNVPKAARILKILIDLVDSIEVAKVAPQQAGQGLKTNKHLYDPQLLELIIASIDYSSKIFSPDLGAPMEMTPGELLEGDIAVRDITGSDGRLLLAAGTELTELATLRLASLAKNDALPGKVEICRVAAS